LLRVRVVVEDGSHYRRVGTFGCTMATVVDHLSLYHRIRVVRSFTDADAQHADLGFECIIASRFGVA